MLTRFCCLDEWYWNELWRSKGSLGKERKIFAIIWAEEDVFFSRYHQSLSTIDKNLINSFDKFLRDTSVNSSQSWRIMCIILTDYHTLINLFSWRKKTWLCRNVISFSSGLIFGCFHLENVLMTLVSLMKNAVSFADVEFTFFDVLIPLEFPEKTT